MILLDLLMPGMSGWETAAATLVAFLVGLGVIAFFMNYISKHSFLPFVIYRIVLGAGTLILLGAGVLSA